jgi:hypothetical protein
MKAIELVGAIDEPAGPVKLIVLLPDEDDAVTSWVQAVAKEWSDDLRDSWQDIYTLEDGQAVNEAR